jgi:hypothetical protein
MKKGYIIFAGILAVGIMTAGCGKKNQDTSQSEQEAQITVAPVSEDTNTDLVDMQQSTEETIRNVIGEKTATASKLTLINNTGATVSSIYIRPTSDDEEEWGDELVQGSFTLSNGDKALYYFEKNAKDSSGNMITQYDVRIVYEEEDRTECYFRKLPLDSITQLTLCMDGSGEDAIPYAKYLTDSSKTEVSTLQEVKTRLGLADSGEESSSSSDGETENSSDSDEDSTTAPAQTQVTSAPEQPSEEIPSDPSDGDDGPDEQEPDAEDPGDTTDDPIAVAESYIGRSLDELIDACGNPTGSDYMNEPETGETGYHYYATFTISTTVDESGNEIVAGVW